MSTAEDTAEQTDRQTADPVDTAPGPGRARGRLRAAVVVGGLGVAAASGIWLSAQAAPHEPVRLVDAVVVDAADAPDDASAEGFCAVYGLPQGFDDDSALARANVLRGRAADLAATGTPADIPARARVGFERYAALSGRVTATEVAALGGGRIDGEALRDGLGLDDVAAADVLVFTRYAAATCFTPPGS